MTLPTQTTRPQARQIAPEISCEDMIRRWPVSLPLAALTSARAGSPWARWSIIATPTETLEPGASDPASALRAICPALSSACETQSINPDGPPFVGGWIGWLSYDLGRSIEPAACSSPGAHDDRGWPAMCIHRCPGAYVFDHEQNQWWVVGDDSSLPSIESLRQDTGINRPYSLGESRSSMGCAGYESAVARTLEYISSGDVFQANIAHRLTRTFDGDPRSYFLGLIRECAPWYGAFIEGPSPGRSVVSVSPELFLSFDSASRRVVTRPIKGTLHASRSRGSLERSDKDRAELVMIIDLMRNDLGKACEFGSVRVIEERTIERHGSSRDASGVMHGVATITGTLRSDTSLVDLLFATFPPGSVTGAPKIRAMQIIDELEPVRRGPYCGAVGFVSDSGDSAWNVAIRTACITGAPLMSDEWTDVRGVVDYAAGAGIVSDSLPAKEWQETLDKAEGFMGMGEGTPARAPAQGPVGAAEEHAR